MPRCCFGPTRLWLVRKPLTLTPSRDRQAAVARVPAPPHLPQTAEHRKQTGSTPTPAPAADCSFRDAHDAASSAALARVRRLGRRPTRPTAPTPARFLEKRIRRRLCAAGTWIFR